MENTSHQLQPRNREEIIIDLKKLIKSKGYFYVLCMILFEDFHLNPEKMHEINYLERLSTKEVALLLGFFIQREVDYSRPNSPLELITMKQKTYILMDELHKSFMWPFFEKLKRSLEDEHQVEDLRKEQKEFFGTGEMLMEPIFYSGSGVYDFQYSEFLERKHKYDIQWLLEKKHFDIKETQNIVKHIKNILQEKSKKVHLLHLKERMPAIIEEMKKKHPDENVEATMENIIPKFELYQYVKLFSDDSSNKELENLDEIREESWNYFYKNLIDLFVIRKIDFEKKYNIEAFLWNFSITPKEGFNSQFQKIGDYNIINSHPIINLDEENYFVTMPYLLFIGCAWTQSILK